MSIHIMTQVWKHSKQRGAGPDAMMEQHTLAWLLENDPEELRRQQQDCSTICSICLKDRLPFESYEHTACDELLLGGIVGECNVFERDGYRCRHCGSGPFSDLTIDHVFPRSRGGSDEAENLQTLCRSCNSKKGAR